MLVDTFGRQITYLRISLTDRCNLRCAYCMPPGGLGWMPSAERLGDEEILQVVEAAARLGISKFRLTGGEPLVRSQVVELVRRIAAVPGVEDLSLTTNATLLEKLAVPLAQAGLKRVNISLDTLDPVRFHRITRLGEFERAWGGILAAESAGLTPIKLNAVIIRGFNDDELLEMARLTLTHPWHVRFIEVMPIGNTGSWNDGLPAANERYMSATEMRARLGELQPVKAAQDGGPARTYRLPGAMGTVGFISPIGEHFCESCNRLRLTADGKLRACLVQPGEVSLREALRQGLPLEELFRQAVAAKPQGHQLEWSAPKQTERGMSQIGG